MEPSWEVIIYNQHMKGQWRQFKMIHVDYNSYGKNEEIKVDYLRSKLLDMIN
jgi:hypothetical protein